MAKAKDDFEVSLNALTQAISAFEKKKATILEKAFAEGGADLVVDVVNEVEALKDVRFELLRANLDKSNAAFAALAKQARAEGEALEQSIRKLQAIAKVLEGIASAVNLFARLIMRFAI
jgi:hypothetical protein